MRAYNWSELFKFITEDLEMYFQRKSLALAFGKIQNLHLAPRCFGATGSTIQLSAVKQSSSDSLKFLAPSRTNSEVNYEVNCRTGMCTWPMATRVLIKLHWNSNMVLQESTLFLKDQRKGPVLQKLQLEIISNFTCKNLFTSIKTNMLTLTWTPMTIVSPWM